MSTKHPVKRHVEMGWTPSGEVPIDGNTRIFIDTCSLMRGGITRFFGDLVPLLRKHGLKVIVPVKVGEELNRIGAAEGKRAAAQRGVKEIKRLMGLGLLELVGRKDDTYADNLFQAQFTRLRLTRRLFLVTEDSGLAHDILLLNQASSVDRIVGVHAVCIGDEGQPRAWVLAERGAARESKKGKKGKNSSKRGGEGAGPDKEGRAPVVPFAKATKPRAMDVRPAASGVAPGKGDTVVDGRGVRHSLEAELGAGGEGTVWATSTGFACKVYLPGRLTRGQVEKLQRMVSHPIVHKAICWPTQLVHNGRGEVVGYLMPRVEGIPLQLSVCMPGILKTRMASWDRTELVRVASAVLEAIEVLHAHNVLLGDLNPRNVLMQDARKVFLVDCDSFQLDGYPCPVGTPAFLAPGLHGVDLKTRLRTMDDELFAVATLLFMIVMPGKLPYAHEGGEEVGANVRKALFPYPLGDRGAQSMPPGPWQFMWSHLPYYTKEALFGVFDQSERLSVADWQLLMQRYENDSLKGHVTSELFPQTFKQLSREQAEVRGGTWTTCPSCGEGFGAFKAWHKTCRTCHAHATHRPVERRVVPPPPVPPPVANIRPPSPPLRPSAARPAPPRATPPRAVAPAPSAHPISTPSPLASPLPHPQPSLWDRIARFFS